MEHKLQSFAEGRGLLGFYTPNIFQYTEKSPIPGAAEGQFTMKIMFIVIILVIITLSILAGLLIFIWIPCVILFTIIEYKKDPTHSSDVFRYGSLGPLYPGYLLVRKVGWRYF